MLLALFADLSKLAAIDRDANRYTFAAGASIYPFAWNVLLAARDEGLGGVITTIAIREEEQVKAILGAADPLALAAVIALGYPVRQPRRLRRAAGELLCYGRFDRRAGLRGLDLARMWQERNLSVSVLCTVYRGGSG